MKTKQRENNFRRSLQDFSATRPSTTERPQAVHEKLEPVTKHSIQILIADDSEDDRMIFQLALPLAGPLQCLAPDLSARTADGRRLQETKRFAEKG